ncbi:hypothetical protein TgHK011_000384 [Trichoderma gracile]|nr:hypothetical protein TgHK011_000384 [Trichoderma gracile]
MLTTPKRASPEQSVPFQRRKRSTSLVATAFSLAASPAQPRVLALVHHCAAVANGAPPTSPAFYHACLPCDSAHARPSKAPQFCSASLLPQVAWAP